MSNCGILAEPLFASTVYEEQLELEKESMASGAMRYRKQAQQAIDRGQGGLLKPAERMVVHWLEPTEALIRDEAELCEKGVRAPGRSIYGAVLQLLDPEVAAAVVAKELLSGCLLNPSGEKYSAAAYRVGRHCFAEINAADGKVSEREEWRKLASGFRRVDACRVQWWAKQNLDDPLVSQKSATALGACLIRILISAASAGSYEDDTFIDAFVHKLVPQRRGTKTVRVGMVYLSDDANRVIEEGHNLRQFLRPRYQPMLIEPREWSEKAEGGYVSIRTPFISKPTREQKSVLAEHDLGEAYRALADLSAMRWKVNERVLELAKRVWELGGDELGMPPADPRPIPPRPRGVSEDEMAAYKKHARHLIIKNHRDRADRRTLASKFSMADSMLDKGFYFPHQFDFRSRCYAIPQPLNHQGDDLCRGLLLAADPVPLDARGLWWLKVHAANMYGVDKVSYSMRAEWTEQHLGDIERMLGNPEDNDFWRKADKPWQFFAACMALADPKGIGSCMMVQMDGTCNGLQHYAALGRDADGAATVNMLPADIPSDIYSHVLSAVRDQVERDSIEREVAREVLPHLSRATVKRPTMTSVYNVTQVGARQQVCEELVDSGFVIEKAFSSSQYLTAVVMQCIARVCPGARQTMDWLIHCAHDITRETGQPLIWTTPIGFPVVQPYRNKGSARIKMLDQHITLPVDNTTLPVQAHKHANGLPPNYVHSIDATHKIMTARAARDNGISFAGVHDSYWTHAASADTLSRLCREQFVSLHQRPLLEDLHSQFQARYKIDLPAPPRPGTYDLRNVLDAPYFFS